MGYRYRNWTKFCLPLAVLFCLILPSLGKSIWASNDSADIKDERLHYIVRHWYADGTHEDDEGYLAEGDSAVTIHVKQKEGETFSGFATAAGHDAVVRERDEDKPENSVLKISYDKDIHLAKVHAFYKDTDLEKEGKDLGSDETKVVKDGTKQYNTSAEGLHTDKTAEVVKNNGREFELTLESWFVGDNRANVGMVLDASGSMAFTSNDLKPIKMSDEQIETYGKMKYIPQSEVNNILNPHYTDNSKLAYSDYTYFVYDPGDQKKEFAPIGYWDGTVKVIEPEEQDLPGLDNLIGYYPFTSDSDRYNEVEIVKGEKEWSEFQNEITQDKDYKASVAVYSASEPESDEDKDGKVVLRERAAKLSSSSKAGFNGNGKALDLAATYRAQESNGNDRKDAARLDINPGTDTFTISFVAKGTDSKPVVWIGEQDQRKKENQAWYAIYVDTVKGKTKVSSGIGVTTEGHNLNKNAEGILNAEGKFEPTDDWAVCTYVFSKKDDDKTEVTIYVNGKPVGNGDLANINLEDKTNPVILLGGSAWAHDYGGENWKDDETTFFLIDELYFYECNLDEAKAEKLYNEMKKDPSTDNIYAAATSSNPDEAIAKLQNVGEDGNGAGWYYVTSGSDWDEITNENLLTAKRYQGIPAGEEIINDLENQDSVGAKDYILTGDGEFTWNPGSPAAETVEDWNGSVIFFIDAEGYLRCFFNTGRNQKRGDDGKWSVNDSYCSYVYIKEDLMRIKTEALQRALGSFVTRLSEASADSQVSAVRFSTENITDLSELVLQKWTSNTMDSTGMLGLRRGKRTVVSYDEQDGKKLYNYVLTGGTVTRTGLKSYLDNLDGDLKGDDAPKSLIIFTDGKDSVIDDEGEEETLKYAEKLKEKGYTIYCVMLQSAGNPPDSAKDFLEKLSSSDGASKDEYVFYADDVESLTEVFTQKILDRIINNLPGYTIRDYIDPRFNLVNADGSVIYLNADGNIIIDGKKKKIDSENGYKVTTTEATAEEAAGTVGENALLFYDSDSDMYYLEWREQTIPGCSVGADRLNVWKTRIRVRAKEDFIGGNAVISNGNADSMNMVFHPDDDDISSGQDDIYVVKDEETGKILRYPSRGFPRTSVNVELLNLKLGNAYQKIYMGETIIPGDALPILCGKVKEQVYYEYLERYMNWISQQGGENQDLMAQLKSGKQIQVPYYYLPDKAGSNQAGKVQPGDQIGWLTYSWTECDEKGVPKSNPTYTSYETKDTNSRYYQLAVSYMPMTEKEREKETAKIISDKDYSSPKNAVGDTQKEIRGLGMHQTDIVSGEIIVEARVLLSDLKYLAKKNGGKLKLKESFSVVRSYKGNESNSELDISFSYTTKKLRALKADTNGYVSVFSAPSDPLPLGKYTLKTMNKTPFQFITISTKEIKDGNGHFSLPYTNEKKESKYAAPATEDKNLNTVSFYLGIASSGDETEVNLDTQLGHAIVTYAPLNITTTKKSNSSNTLGDNNLPQERAYGDRAPDTGDRAEPLHVLVLMVMSAVLVSTPIMKNIRRNRKF